MGSRQEGGANHRGRGVGVSAVTVAGRRRGTANGNGLLQSETTGATTTNYTWNVETSLPLLLSDGTNYYIYGPGNNPIEQIAVSGGATSYLLADELGSIRAITNASRTTTGTFTYDAWGNETGSTGSATTPFGFAGEYLDSASGFYYLRARWYDASTGEFMSLDPKVATTLEPYQYVGNDPLNGSDPSGLSSCNSKCQEEKKAAADAAEAKKALTKASAAAAVAAAAESSYNPNAEQDTVNAEIAGDQAAADVVQTAQAASAAGEGLSINASNLSLSGTLANSANAASRAYWNSSTVTQWIIDTNDVSADPQGTSALMFRAEGAYNGSLGNYELLINPETNTILHYVFKGSGVNVTSEADLEADAAPGDPDEP